METFKSFKFCKIRFNPLFFLLATIMFILGYISQFVVVLLVVSLHECAHIAVGYFFNLTLEELYITPFGERATLKNFDTLSSNRKILVVIAGPLCNVILYFLSPDNFTFFKDVNLAILFFNILPIYPLDGFRLFQIEMSRRVGIINANKFLSVLSRNTCNLAIFLGFVQVVLYPFNVSLLFLSFYLSKINKNGYDKMIFDFYNIVLLKEAKLKYNNFLHLEYILVNKETDINLLINKINWDKYYIVHFVNGKDFLYFTESEIIKFYLKNGYSSKMKDLLSSV